MFSRLVSSTASRALAVSEHPVRIISRAFSKLTSQDAHTNLATVVETAPDAVSPSLPPSSLTAAIPDTDIVSEITSKILDTSQPACKQAVSPTSVMTNSADSRITNKIWSEVGGVSLEEAMRILRTPAVDPLREGESNIESATIRQNDTIRTFMKAESFKHLRSLRLTQPTAAQLAELVDRLEARKHKALTLHLISANALRANMAARLSTLSLAGLHLDYEIHGTATEVLESLSKSKFPIALRGNFTQDGLMAASAISTLTSLHMTGRGTDDRTARFFASHRSLEAVYLGVNWNLSSQGIGAIAAIPTLRELSIDDWSPRWVNAEVASTLAASKRFTSLDIRSKGPAVPSANFSVLGESTALKNLRIPSAPSMPYLENLHSLEHLELHNDSFRGIVCLEAASARIITSLPKLQSLQLSSMYFKRDALATILSRSQVEKLSFRGYHWFHDGDTKALLSNTHIKELTIKDGYLPAADIVALLSHPTLDRLSINTLEFLRHPDDAKLTLRDAQSSRAKKLTERDERSQP